MTITAWVSIGIFFGGVVWSILWYLARKRQEAFESRLAIVEAAVSGDNGIRSKIMGLVTTEALEARMVGMSSQLLAVKEEGERREERILDAIKDNTRTISDLVSDVRSDLRSQSTRIDQLFRKGD